MIDRTSRAPPAGAMRPELAPKEKRHVTEENKNLVRRFFEDVWNTHSLAWSTSCSALTTSSTASSQGSRRRVTASSSSPACTGAASRTGA